MKAMLKASVAATALAFAVSAQAAEKPLIVATDTAFVPFEFKRAINMSVSISTCGMPSPSNYT